MIDGITYRQWLLGQLVSQGNLVYMEADKLERTLGRYLVFVDAVIDAEAESAPPEDDLFPDLSRFGISPDGLQKTIAAMQSEWHKTLYPKE